MLPGCGSPRWIAPTNVLLAGSTTEIVFENCSPRYTRSRELTGWSGADAAAGAWPASTDPATATSNANADMREQVPIRVLPSGTEFGDRRRRAAGQNAAQKRYLVRLLD